MSEDATSTRSREVNAGCAPVQATHRWSRLLSLARGPNRDALPRRGHLM